MKVGGRHGSRGVGRITIHCIYVRHCQIITSKHYIKTEVEVLEAQSSKAVSLKGQEDPDPFSLFSFTMVPQGDHGWWLWLHISQIF